MKCKPKRVSPTKINEKIMYKMCSVSKIIFPPFKGMPFLLGQIKQFKR